MPRHSDNPPVTDKGKKSEKAGAARIMTVGQLPLNDRVDWQTKILKGTKEERRAAIDERLAAIHKAIEKGDKATVPTILAEFAFWHYQAKMDEEFDRVNEEIAKIHLTEEHFDTLVKMLRKETDSESRGAAIVLGLMKNEKVVPCLIEALKDPNTGHSYIIEALGRIGGKQAVSALVAQVKETVESPVLVLDCIGFTVATLGDLGDQIAIAPLKALLKHATRFEMDNVANEAEAALEKLGVPKHEIEKIMENSGRTETERDVAAHLNSPDQMAVYLLVSKNKNIKRLVFENARVLDILPDRQAWLTINEPQLAKDALQLVLNKLGNRIGGLDNALASSIGVRAKQLEESHFIYFADEILDTVAQMIRNSPLKNDEELAALLSGIRYGNGVTLRYMKREVADLSLGDKCGDCTAKGSVNFGNSVTWLVNPAYQILKMSKEGRFIGKINFTIGNLDGKDAIIIDALEFNPQAQKDKPYYEDGKECLNTALEFLRGLAKRENRELFALATSNSSGAVAMLRAEAHRLSRDSRETKPLDEPIAVEGPDGIEMPVYPYDPKHDQVPLTLLVPQEDVCNILARAGYKDEVKFFYQMLDSTVDSRPGGVKELTDAKLPDLEREVINPAQIAKPEVATAMRERDFAKASALILMDEGAAFKIREIFKLPSGIPISPKFLSSRMERIYKTGALDVASLRRTFVVDANSFVRL
jgi:hypothetical protein